MQGIQRRRSREKDDAFSGRETRHPTDPVQLQADPAKLAAGNDLRVDTGLQLVGVRAVRETQDDVLGGQLQPCASRGLGRRSTVEQRGEQRLPPGLLLTRDDLPLLEVAGRDRRGDPLEEVEDQPVERERVGQLVWPETVGDEVRADPATEVVRREQRLQRDAFLGAARGRLAQRFERRAVRDHAGTERLREGAQRPLGDLADVALQLLARQLPVQGDLADEVIEHLVDEQAQVPEQDAVHRYAVRGQGLVIRHRHQPRKSGSRPSDLGQVCAGTLLAGK